LIGEHDERQRYCRMLGHSVPFGYCRSVKGGIPCSRVLDCWFEIFPIRSFIDEHYGEDERSRIFAPPKSKMETLVELVNQAKARAEEGSG
jgi:hypothetical protein